MGPINDIKRLVWSYPWLPSLHSISGVLDIYLLAKKGIIACCFCAQNLFIFQISYLHTCHCNFFLSFCLLQSRFSSLILLHLLFLLHCFFYFFHFLFPRHVRTLFSIGYPGTTSRELEGVNKLSLKQLGLPVDKSMQCSDWSERPLLVRKRIYN